MSRKILLVVPEAPVQQAAAASAQRTITAKGLRLGTLDNSKSNADHLLAMLVAGVQAQMRVDSVVQLRKPTPSLPADAEVLDQLAEEADIVVSAMAD
ncbi:MAG: hypothetical protein EHM59_19060 [Betaproteobacteria bacterium]|nr:MAG: hypothetical protein EHM59_19060 [Betaproteobacteria bacterium]